MKAKIILLSVVLMIMFKTSSMTGGNNKQQENEEEWRTLDKDETVPVGSHVRIDLTTGHRAINVANRIKQQSRTSLVTVEPDKEKIDEKNNPHSGEKTKEEDNFTDELRQRLKKIYGDDPKSSDDEEKKIRDKFKSYEDLKKDLDELQIAVRTDIEIMNSIIGKYRKLSKSTSSLSDDDEEQLVSMLKSIEFLVHQIDNAHEFIKNDGLKTIVLPSLNSTSSKVRSKTARLLGSATQSNIAAQIAALETGAVGTLLRLIALDSDVTVRSSSLYALSCLVRGFPMAQKQFVDEGGLTVLKNFFNSEVGDKLKVRVKIVTFIHDLIVEKQDAEKNVLSLSADESGNISSASLDMAKERLRQYNLLGLETKLQEQQWCRQLSQLLVQQLSQHLDRILATIKTHQAAPGASVEHDVVEKVLNALTASAGLCLNDLESDSEVRTVLKILFNYYSELARINNADDDNYFGSIVSLIEHVSLKLNMKLHDHDEL